MLPLKEKAEKMRDNFDTQTTGAATLLCFVKFPTFRKEWITPQE